MHSSTTLVVIGLDSNSPVIKIFGTILDVHIYDFIVYQSS